MAGRIHFPYALSERFEYVFNVSSERSRIFCMIFFERNIFQDGFGFDGLFLYIYYMIEIWKDIEGYEGLYQVSNTGKIRSLHYRKYGGIHLLKQNTYDKHKTIILSKDGIHKSYKVHRLVAQAFIPNPEGKPCIDHIDGNGCNNIYTNLRWVTKKENSNNPNTINNMTFHKGIIPWNKGKNYEMHKTRGEKHRLSKPVIQMSLDGEFIQEWESAGEAERALGISGLHASISSCCRGKSKQGYGYKWKFKEVV